MRCILGLAAGSFYLASCLAAAADCVQAYTFNVVVGGTTTTTMTPRVGKSCRLRLGRIDMRVDGVKLVRPPSHGKVGWSGKAVAYVGTKPGPDHFSFEWVGVDRYGKPNFMGVDVDVTVLP